MPYTSGRGWGWEGASPWSQEGLGSLAGDGKVGGGWKGGGEVCYILYLIFSIL